MLFMQHRFKQRDWFFSGDTDVMVLALHFNTDLKTNGLSELWMRAGVGDSTRYIPLHLITEKKQELCTVLPEIHILAAVIQPAKLEPSSLLGHRLFNCSMNLENHCLVQIKMKSYAKRSKILNKYSSPKVDVLLWMI